MSTHQNKQKAREAAAAAQVQKQQPVLQAHGSDTAPVIFFDGAVAYGIQGQTMRIELATTCSVPVSINGKAEARQRVLVTCHLRGSLEAMAQLSDTIEKCLVMGQIPEQVVEQPADVKHESVADH